MKALIPILNALGGLVTRLAPIFFRYKREKWERKNVKR